jgi:hypothetical protein
VQIVLSFIAHEIEQRVGGFKTHDEGGLITTLFPLVNDKLTDCLSIYQGQKLDADD